jgi:DNA-binding CsgD family transcriptional regulator
LFEIGVLSTAGKTQYNTILPGEEINAIYLSAQEIKCLRLLMAGMTAKAIGKHLAISPRTVEHYLENIRNKFNVKNKIELIDKLFNYLHN